MATINPRGASNWMFGKKGFQSALNQCQQVGLLLCWNQNEWKNKPVKTFLESRYRLLLPSRTLVAYKKRLKVRLDMFFDDQDSLVNWDDFTSFDKFGIPQSQLKQLFEMWISIRRICLEVGVEPITPSYRELKWWSYMNEYYSDSISIQSDRQIIGDQYYVRDIFSKINNRAIYKEDIDLWLMYKPWISKSNMDMYVSKIVDGTVIPVDLNTYGWGIEISDESENTSTYPVGYGLSVLNWLLSTSPEPYLLPSQIIDRYSIYATH